MPTPYWKKGQSGNPRGRPKSGHSFTDLISMVAHGEGPSGRAKNRRIVDKLYEMAEKGNLAAIEYIINRCDGKPTERIDARVDTTLDAIPTDRLIEIAEKENEK